MGQIGVPDSGVNADRSAEPGQPHYCDSLDEASTELCMSGKQKENDTCREEATTETGAVMCDHRH